MFFIERREDRWQHLTQLLGPYVKAPQRNLVVALPILGSADGEVRRLLQKKGTPTVLPHVSFPGSVWLLRRSYGARREDHVRYLPRGILFHELERSQSILDRRDKMARNRSRLWRS